MIGIYYAFGAHGVKGITPPTFWDSATGACTLILAGHEGDVNSAVFSADGVSVLTASKNCTAKVWDSTTGPCKLTLTGHDAKLF